MTTYPWTRFWVRRSGNLDLSDGGYLVDPEDREFPLHQGDMFAAADLQNTQCLALLGEPGIGKTTALQSLVAVVVNREVELRKSDEADIRIDAVSREHPRQISVLVEVKGCWNDDVCEDMQGQRRDRYMRNSGIRCGLYVVGWYSCDAWVPTDYRKGRTKPWTLAASRDYFDRQARDMSCNGMLIRAVVLDLTVPW